MSRLCLVLIAAAACGCGPGLSSHPGERPGDIDVTADADGDNDAAGDGDTMQSDDSGDSVSPPQTYRGISYVSWFQGAPVYDRDESDTVVDEQLAPIGANLAFVNQTMSIDVDGNLIDNANTETTVGLTRVLGRLRNNGLKTGVFFVLDVDRRHWAPDASITDAFFASYTQELVALATIAESQSCSFFSIGFELESISNGYATQWANVITAVRAHFSGTLTYHFFNTEASSATFVDQLDIIGIDSMLPLACSDTPSASDIADGWAHDNACSTYDPLAGQAPLDYLAGLASAHDKQILFTALGFRSEQGAAKAPETVSGGPTDNSVQNNAWQGTLEVLMGTSRPWYGGLVVWEMMPYVTPEAQTTTVGPNDYTPQNKAAYDTIKGFFTQ